MRQSHFEGNHAQRQLMQRLDRAFGEINVVLAALAIGLAVLDTTCFCLLAIDRPLMTALYDAGAGNSWLTVAPAPDRR